MYRIVCYALEDWPNGGKRAACSLFRVQEVFVGPQESSQKVWSDFIISIFLRPGFWDIQLYNAHLKLEESHRLEWNLRFLNKLAVIWNIILMIHETIALEFAANRCDERGFVFSDGSFRLIDQRFFLILTVYWQLSENFTAKQQFHVLWQVLPDSEWVIYYCKFFFLDPNTFRLA